MEKAKKKSQRNENKIIITLARRKPKSSCNRLHKRMLTRKNWRGAVAAAKKTKKTKEVKSFVKTKSQVEKKIAALTNKFKLISQQVYLTWLSLVRSPPPPPLLPLPLRGQNKEEGEGPYVSTLFGTTFAYISKSIGNNSNNNHFASSTSVNNDINHFLKTQFDTL